MGKGFCDPQNLKLTGVPRIYFVKSQWENLQGNDQVSLPFLVYRAIFLLYFVICLIYNLTRIQSFKFFSIAATNWAFLIQTLYGALFFGLLLVRFLAQKRDENKRRKRDKGKNPGNTIQVGDLGHVEENEMTDFDFENGEDLKSPRNLSRSGIKAVKLSTKMDSTVWLLLSVTGTIPYIVTLGYWIFVYSPEELVRNGTSIGRTLTVHGFNTIFALVDILVIAIPVRVAHSLYTMAFTLVYLVFSCIYEYAGGSYKVPERPFIYSLLNWREKPGWAVVACVGALITAFILHIFLWSLYKFRLLAAGWLRK